MGILATLNGAVPWIETDGGRAQAGYKGITADCAVRSAALALEIPYKEVYAVLGKFLPKGQSLRGGVMREDFHRYLSERGCEWVPVMGIGTGCTMRLRTAEVPPGRIIVRCSEHYAAVIDRVLYDNHDCRRDGNRCVYGYWTMPKETRPEPG